MSDFARVLPGCIIGGLIGWNGGNPMSSFDFLCVGVAVGFLVAVIAYKAFNRQKPTPMTEEDYWLG